MQVLTFHISKRAGMFFFSKHLSAHAPVSVCIYACERERVHHGETNRGVITLLEGLAPRQHFYSSAKDSCTHCPSISTCLREGKGEREREKERWASC